MFSGVPSAAEPSGEASSAIVTCPLAGTLPAFWRSRVTLALPPGVSDDGSPANVPPRSTNAGASVKGGDVEAALSVETVSVTPEPGTASAVTT